MKTPQNLAKNLQKKLNINNNIYLKREDQHPFHSHKGRSIPVMIQKHYLAGQNNFCISSSGNAALAAMLAIKEHNKNNDKKLTLQVFIGNNITEEKLKILQKEANDMDNVCIKQINTPKQKAFQLDKEGKAKFLRQSTDKYALKGYHELAKELSVIPQLTAVFIPTSSGTTAVGLYEGFKKLKINPQIHIIQTEQCHALLTNEGGKINKKEKSLANAIVDQVGHRKKEAELILKNTNGQGWIVNNEDIQNAINLIKESENIDMSGNSALSVAGLMKAKEKNYDLNGSIVCLITGK